MLLSEIEKIKKVEETRMNEYIERLVVSGMNPNDATIIVNDFMRDSDFDGLKQYVLEFETIRKEACYVHPV